MASTGLVIAVGVRTENGKFAGLHSTGGEWKNNSFDPLIHTNLSRTIGAVLDSHVVWVTVADIEHAMVKSAAYRKVANMQQFAAFKDAILKAAEKAEDSDARAIKAAEKLLARVGLRDAVEQKSDAPDGSVLIKKSA